MIQDPEPPRRQAPAPVPDTPFYPFFPPHESFSQGLLCSPKLIGRLMNELYAVVMRESWRQTIAVCIEVPIV